MTTFAEQVAVALTGIAPPLTVNDSPVYTNIVLTSPPSPSLPVAPIVAAISGDTDMPIAGDDVVWSAGKARHALRKWASSDNSGDPSTIDYDKFGRAFMWRDGGGTQIGDFRLPYAMPVNGDLTIIPRGVKAVAGGHGVGVITGADRSALRTRICTLYDKVQKSIPTFPDCPFGASAQTAAASSGYAGVAVMAMVDPGDAALLAQQGGEPADQLHVTVGYLSQPADSYPPDVRDLIDSALAAVWDGPVDVLPFATALFNPGGDPEDPSQAPCGVLLVQSADLLDLNEDVTQALQGAVDDDKFPIWFPHISISYGAEPPASLITGDMITLDRLVVAWGADQHVVATGDVAPDDGMTAAVGGQVFAASDFVPPKFDGPTPLTLTPDGRVYGHLRPAGACHLDFKNKCVNPQGSPSGYKRFHVHGARLEDGSVMPVGAITLGPGHVSRGNLVASRQHYADVSTMAAKVRAGDDKYGTWIAGRVLDSVSDHADDLLLSPLSGHWEPDPDQGGALEMIAAHVVVTPGFYPGDRPVPLVAAHETEGDSDVFVVTSLGEPGVLAAAEPMDEMGARKAQVAAMRKRRRAPMVAAMRAKMGQGKTGC